MNFIEIIRDAAAKREHLQSLTDAYRICNGQADGLGGVVIDRYADNYQIQFFTDEFLRFENEIAAAARELFAVKFLIVKYRMGGGVVGANCNSPIVGAGFKPALTAEHNGGHTIITENSLKFSVDLTDTLNPGLFLDMRDARLAFAKLCEGKNVLNLFAYTCSFSVYARKFGALKAVSVDISKKNLNKGRENFLLNGIEPQGGEFFCGSAEEYVDWCIKKEKKFGSVVIDPPSFAKNGKCTWSVAKNFENLLVKVVQILEEGGVLLACTNYSEWNNEILRKKVANAFAFNHKQAAILQEGTQGDDFPGTGMSKESCMSYSLWRSSGLTEKK
ncbi:methyltransferase [Fibrobacterales bacterium]|nr:methyltransferase [Fibrobacterales bacterium]